jgi:pimeloyl-ACP methyl ester carboxylesterase
MISGTPPLGASESSQPPFYPDSAAEATLKRDLSEKDRESFLKALFGKEGFVIPEFFQKDLDRADGRVREVIGISAQKGDFRDEVAIVRNMETPLALVHGREDSLVNPEYLRDIEYGNLYRNRIIDIPQAGHTPQWEQPGRFESVLDDFIKANCGG